MRSIHAFDEVKLVDRFSVLKIAAKPVDRIRRVSDDLASEERIHCALDLARLRMEWIHLDEQGAWKVTGSPLVRDLRGDLRAGFLVALHLHVTDATRANGTLVSAMSL